MDYDELAREAHTTEEANAVATVDADGKVTAVADPVKRLVPQWMEQNGLPNMTVKLWHDSFTLYPDEEIDLTDKGLGRI